MKDIEYYLSVDKDRWPEGPWMSEPDKVQWVDQATGLPCLIVRGPVGALCGYVGVPLVRAAFHRVTCLSSKHPLDLALAQGYMQRAQAEASKV